MIKMEMIIATSRSDIPKKFQAFSIAHPNMEIKRTEFVCASNYDYTLLIFYDEPEKVVKKEETAEEFFARIEKEMAEMKYKFDHFFDDVPKELLHGDVSARVLNGIEQMSSK